MIDFCGKRLQARIETLVRIPPNLDLAPYKDDNDKIILAPHAFPQNSGKLFLLAVDAQDSGAAGDCCGEVSRSNRGSFLIAKNNAGATARGAASQLDQKIN